LGSSQIFGELFTFFPSQTTTHHFLQNIRVKLDGSRKTIGGFDNVSTYFEDISLHLPEDSVLYFASDGFADQHNVQRKKYTEKRLLRTLETNYYVPLPTQKVQLEAEIQEYMKGTEQRDDILVFGIKI
jgi:serine phosphatase RsbU (regulator of sigma subunit)